MKITKELRSKIEKAIWDNVHCMGCDEWGCGGYEECDGTKEINNVVGAIVKLLEKVDD